MKNEKSGRRRRGLFFRGPQTAEHTRQNGAGLRPGMAAARTTKGRNIGRKCHSEAIAEESVFAGRSQRGTRDRMERASAGQRLRPASLATGFFESRRRRIFAAADYREPQPAEAQMPGDRRSYGNPNKDRSPSKTPLLVGRASASGGGGPPVIRLSFFGAFFRKKRRKNAPPHVSDYGRGPNAESGG